MARRSSAARPIIVRSAPAKAPIIRVSAPANLSRSRRVGRAAGRAARSAGRGIVSEKHTITAILAAAAFGMLEKSDVKIPTIGGIGPAGTAGIVAWAVGRMTKNQTAQHVATGLLAVAVNRWVATGSIAGDEVLGDGRAVVYE